MIEFQVIADRDALLSPDYVKDRLTNILYSVAHETENQRLLHDDIEKLAEDHLRKARGGQFQAGVFRYHRFITHSRSIDPKTPLHVRNPHGDIRITGAETAQCAITASVHVSAPTDEEAKALLREVDFVFHEENDGLHLKTSELHTLFPGHEVRIDCTLTVPHTIPLLLANGGGKVTLEGLHQAVHLGATDPLLAP